MWFCSKKGPEMASNQTAVIVGGRQAGAWAARTFWTEGFTGPITLVVSEEDHPPYERPSLSKQLMTGNDSIESTHNSPAKARGDWNAQFLLGKRVTAINTQATTISLHSGERFAYDKVLPATGGVSRRIGLTGVALKNLFYLRVTNTAKTSRSSATPWIATPQSPLHSATDGASISFHFRHDKVAGTAGINAGRETRLQNRHLDSGRVLDVHALTERPLQETSES
jgi:hypothetical protein